MYKQALLAVSFGTSHLDTLERTIAMLEGDLSAAFPHSTLRRAFTSGMICKKLRERDGLVVDSVPEALARLAGEGYDSVVLQPGHILNGGEYEKLLAQAAPFQTKFAKLSIGAPLLTAIKDYCATAQALCAHLPEPASDTAQICMGHGTAHAGNPAYAQLEYVCHDLGRRDLLIATVEGYPDFSTLLRRLDERPTVKKITLRPLMLVAGDHAKNDLAGGDPSSWYSRLSALGYGVNCDLRGLGEYPEIRAIFVAHASAAAHFVENRA